MEVVVAVVQFQLVALIKATVEQSFQMSMMAQDQRWQRHHLFARLLAQPVYLLVYLSIQMQVNPKQFVFLSLLSLQLDFPLYSLVFL